MYHTGDPAIHRDFVDNRSTHTDRTPHDDIKMDVRPAVRFVDEPTDYSDKLRRARGILAEMGITQIKPLRGLKR